MNPGPAPRPPTDRLRLTPSTSSTLPGNMSGLSLQSSSPSSSTTNLVRTQSEKSTSSYQTVKEGYAKVKEEGLMKFWSEKYLILREYQLDFLKSHTSPKVSFTVQLRDVTSVSRCEDHPYAMSLVRAASTSNGASPPRDGPTKVLICRFETDDEVYSWIDSIYARCPQMGVVSNPTNFTHRVHVGFDPTSGAFVGLPVEWEKLLTASAITKDDYQKNPKAVLEVLEFYTEKLVKRSEDPAQYPSLTPTPPIDAGQNKQLGYSGSSIAPPRPGPPNGFQRKDSYNMSRTETRTPPGQYPSSNEKSNLAYQQQQEARAEEERRRKKEEEIRMQRERERQEAERREREELAAYNASLPKTKVPLAKQELGGYGGDVQDSRQADRYNPSRPAPSTPTAQRDRQQPPGSLRQISAQRPAPSAPTGQNGSYPKPGQPKGPSQPGQRPPQSGPTYKPQQPVQRPPNGATPSQARSPGPQPPKPLNVQPKQQQAQVPDGVKKAEAALTAPKKEEPSKSVRMSQMTESEVMARLREVVSKDKPLDSYNKQKKIGQGASGSVYVARIKESATSPTARDLLKLNGPRAQVAIKQMDLRNQPRKELIVNEIIVMKDSKHPNIVNFLDAFLQEEQSELWVVMEFMEGGALTDVIDNNPSISEDQIATICLEVCIFENSSFHVR
jgi:serine/threonine-protein kinase CLA4